MTPRIRSGTENSWGGVGAAVQPSRAVRRSARRPRHAQSGAGASNEDETVRKRGQMPTTATLGTHDGDMSVYDAEPEEPAKAAVIVIQEAFGVNEHIEDVTRRFAAEGYRAVAPHLFHRSGDPALGYDDISQVMPHMQEV